MKDMLKTIIAKSPAAARDAIKCLQAITEDSPMVKRRFYHVVEMALSDPQADFSESERVEMAECLDRPEDGMDANRSMTVRFRVTETERMLLHDLATSEGMSESEFIRRRIFGE